MAIKSIFPVLLSPPIFLVEIIPKLLTVVGGTRTSAKRLENALEAYGGD